MTITRTELPETLGALYVCPVDGSYREQHETAYALLAECLPLYAEERHISIGTYSVQRSETGKPFLPELPALHFNLSHCKGLAACLLSPYECGVDAEMRRPLRERVVGRIFSGTERYMLYRADDPDMLFTELWTMKEAYVKAIGTGISYPMREVCFSLENGALVPQKQDAVFWHTTMQGFSVSACFLKEDTPAAHSCP